MIKYISDMGINGTGESKHEKNPFGYSDFSGIILEILAVRKMRQKKKMNKVLLALVFLLVLGAVYAIPVKDRKTGVKTAKHIVFINCKQYSGTEKARYLLEESDCQVNFEYYPDMPEFLQKRLEKEADKTELVKEGILVLECEGKKAAKIEGAYLHTAAVYRLGLDDIEAFIKSKDADFIEKNLKSFHPDFHFKNLSYSGLDELSYLFYGDKVFFINWSNVCFWDEEAGMQYNAIEAQGNKDNLKMVLYKRDQTQDGLVWQYPLWIDLEAGKLSDRLQGAQIEGAELADMSQMRYLKGRDDFEYFLLDEKRIYEVNCKEKNSRLLYETEGEEQFEALQLLNGKYFLSTYAGDELKGFYYNPETREKQVLFENRPRGTVECLGEDYLVIKKENNCYCYSHTEGTEWKIETLNSEYLMEALKVKQACFEGEGRFYFEYGIDGAYRQIGVLQPEKHNYLEIVQKEQKEYRDTYFYMEDGFLILEQKNGSNEMETEEWKLKE